MEDEDASNDDTCTDVTCAHTAAIGGSHYDSLPSAIDTAGDGAVVTLLSDTTENVVVGEGQSIVLELNGKTLNGGSATKKAALTNKDTVTIQDSSNSGIGTIKHDDTEFGYYTVVNEKSMTIAGGTITNSATGSNLMINYHNQGGGKSYGANSGVEMTISGGRHRQSLRCPSLAAT